MAVTYTWSVANTERNLSDGGIIVIHWRCTGVDGDYTASSYGTTSHEYDADAADFVAYDSVTEVQAIGWAQAALDQSAIEAAISDNITAQKTPTTGDGVPW
jgi:hypothetical protein